MNKNGAPSKVEGSGGVFPALREVPAFHRFFKRRRFLPDHNNSSQFQAFRSTRREVRRRKPHGRPPLLSGLRKRWPRLWRGLRNVGNARDRSLSGIGKSLLFGRVTAIAETSNTERSRPFPTVMRILSVMRKLVDSRGRSQVVHHINFSLKCCSLKSKECGGVF